MADPRFNSIHLGPNPQRRQLYRQARDVMLDARGPMTIAGSALDGWGLGMLNPCRWAQDRPGECWLQDLNTGQAYPLRIGTNAVGRFANNDIVQDRRDISRRHCVFVLHSNLRCEVHDTASRNGTFVNGQRIDRPVWLAAGDVIQLAKWMVRFLNGDVAESVDVEDTLLTIDT